MRDFIAKKYTAAQIEEMSWKNLEDKVNRKRLNQINVPYEKERLRLQIATFEESICQQTQKTMKSQQGMTHDPALNQFKMRQKRLQNIMTKLLDLEASYNEKMQQALALKYEEELSNELDNQKVGE